MTGSALLAGCFGYTRTMPEDYELLNAGYVDGDAWLDIAYSGEEDGRIQYRLFIEESGVFVEDSSTQVKMLETGGSYRLTAPIDAMFDVSNSSIGLRLINPAIEGGTRGKDLDVGSVPI